MPNVGEVLKNEISRVSKKVIRAHLSPIQSATIAHRRQLAVLKKQVQQLEREIAALRRASEKGISQPEIENDTKLRFTAKGLKSLRNRLGLSADEFGRLVQVGAQTVYNWESEKTSPRPAQVLSIVRLRKIGKREARTRLDAMGVA
jgi:DNA-binding transcriptional regulator YiaG